MILSPSDTAPPNLFLRGARAPAGGVQSIDTDTVSFEPVGTIVLKSEIRFDGTLVADPAALVESDEPFDEMPDTGPFRREAEIAIYKPEADVVVVDDLRTILPAALFQPPPMGILDPASDTDTASAFQAQLDAAAFGTVAVDRGAGFGPGVARVWGWRDRLSNPRIGDAGTANGIPADQFLENFDGKKFELPVGYRNSFQNGAALPGEAPFAEGDRLRFAESGGGPVRDLVIPAAPALAATDGDGTPLSPPLALSPRVDTVVMDRAAQSYTLIWRATFPWEDRYQNATLEVG